jgi:hypothetical protein
MQGFYFCEFSQIGLYSKERSSYLKDVVLGPDTQDATCECISGNFREGFIFVNFRE